MEFATSHKCVIEYMTYIVFEEKKLHKHYCSHSNPLYCVKVNCIICLTNEVHMDKSNKSDWFRIYTELIKWLFTALSFEFKEYANCIDVFKVLGWHIFETAINYLSFDLNEILSVCS